MAPLHAMGAGRRPLYDRHAGGARDGGGRLPSPSSSAAEEGGGGGRGGGGRGGVDNLLDSIGWKHIFFLLAAFVILRPFLLAHPVGSRSSSSAVADVKGGHAPGGGAAGEGTDLHRGKQHHHGTHGKRHGSGGDAEGGGSSSSSSGGGNELASVEDAVVEWEGPEPRGGSGLMQKLTAATLSESEAMAAAATAEGGEGGGGEGEGGGSGGGGGGGGKGGGGRSDAVTVPHVSSSCCGAGLPQWAPWVETQEQCRWECGGGHLVAVGVGLLNRKQRAGLKAPEPWECAWSCVSTVDKRTLRCAACPYAVTAGVVSRDALTRHDSNAASCAMQPCSRACEGSFGRWSPCSKPCGGGTQLRPFEVTIREEFGGAPCDFEDGYKEYRDCNDRACAVDCQGYWDEWGECSKACGGGQQVRRYVVETPAAHDGLPCGWSHGAPKTRICNAQPCPVQCEGNWTAFSECDEPCGGGSRRRRFNVFVESANGGRPCEHGHGDVNAEECNTQPCPVDCIGSFSPWGECSAPCGGGHRNRTYYVLSPAQNGGAACERQHEETETEGCNQGKSCEVDCLGEWSRWSKCVAADVDPLGRLCGPGQKSRRFTVTRQPRFGGKPCQAKHGQTHRIGCTERPCPRDCAGAWDEWEECDAQCGGGMQKRAFRITTTAHAGGAPCEAEALETQFRKCNVHQCVNLHS